MKTLAIALFSTLMAFSNASFWEAGPCPPKPEVITPFEVEGYLGDWYTQWETPMPYGTSENTCTPLAISTFTWALSQVRAGFLTPTTRTTLQLTLVRKTHSISHTSRMLPSPRGTPSHLR